MTKELLTIGDFAVMSNLGRTRIYELLKRGEVKAVKIGRRTFIRREDAEAWMSNLAAYPAVTSSVKGADHV